MNIAKILKIALFRGFGALALLLVTFTVTNTLSTEESGKFLYLHSLILVISPILVFGTNAISLREIAILHGRGQLGQLNGVIVWGFIVITGVAILFFIVGNPLAKHFLTGVSGIDWIVNLGFTPIAISFVISLTILTAHQLQGLSQPTLSVLSLSILSPLGFTIVMYGRPDLFLNAEHSIVLLAISSCFGLLFAATALIILAPKVKPKPSRSLGFVKACIPVWIVAIATAITNWGAQLISLFYISDSEIALLSVAQRIAMSMSLILIAVNLIVSPMIAKLYDQKELDKLQTLVSRTVLGIAAITIPIAFLLVMFPEHILGLFGSEYRYAEIFLLVFAAGQLVNILTGPSVQLLMMTGHEVLVMKIAVFSSVLTLLSALTLVSVYGAIGVAIATAIGISSQNVLSAIGAHRKIGISIFKFRMSI